MQIVNSRNSIYHRFEGNEMFMKNDISIIKRTVLQTLIIVMVILLVSSILIPCIVWADDGSEEATVNPLREIHKVRVNKKNYCFFVENNVVMTPEDIKNAKTDEKLTAEILKRAGLYMIETNCKDSAHDAITMQQWIKKGGSFLLSQEDLDQLRKASPSKGKTVKLSMDVLVSDKKAALVKTEPEKKETADSGSDAGSETASEAGSGSDTPDSTDGTDSSDGTDNTVGSTDSTDDKKNDTDQSEAPKYKYSAPVYSTYKPMSEDLIFVIVATKADAKTADFVCEDPNADDAAEEPAEEPVAAEPEEILPEYRTIYMEDRTGAPIEATLKDGEKVNLKWIEPGSRSDGEDSSPIDRVPGGIAGILAIAALIIAAVAGTVVAAKRKKRS